ncbi:MAG: hypothetical protein ACJAQT_000351 [Akkermansiaceae bacterium]|jgi:hypothetical protein
MKRRLIIISAVLVVAVGLFWVRHISTEGTYLNSKDFLEKAEELHLPTSMTSLSYEGIKEERAYLRSWHMSRFPEYLYSWTPLHEFDEKTRRDLKNNLGQWSHERPAIKLKVKPKNGEENATDKSLKAQKNSAAPLLCVRLPSTKPKEKPLRLRASA